jgi:hypothetical protein
LVKYFKDLRARGITKLSNTEIIILISLLYAINELLQKSGDAVSRTEMALLAGAFILFPGMIAVWSLQFFKNRKLKSITKEVTETESTTAHPQEQE